MYEVQAQARANAKSATRGLVGQQVRALLRRGGAGACVRACVRACLLACCMSAGGAVLVVVALLLRCGVG
jgi:hypothetical protein